MDERIKYELDQKIEVHHNYFSNALKLMAFFLAIMGALLKFAIESPKYSDVFCIAGAVISAIAMIVSALAFVFNISLSKDVRRLSCQLGIRPISIIPVLILSLGALCANAIFLVGWYFLAELLRSR